ncbi:HEPN domain-containing protein [Aureivirga marina]|uniref:HEPN domain-containing protein n=1 Tax=Aureivirga marina TaxID=1182451 RepID=UPI0018C9D7D1|nr:HEPN domain-containing protein [Aureivirga marina]
MEEIKLEYIVIFENKSTFCTDIKTFNNLLMTDINIKVNRKEILYKNLKVNYNNSIIKNNNRRIFDITFTLKDIDKIEQFSEFTKVFRSLIIYLKGHINLQRDEVSHYYSKLAYPKINKIENVLRNLISRFMIINVGTNWEENYFPKEIRNTINKKNIKNKYTSDLHSIDFIDLAGFLFNKYSTKEKSISQLIKLIDSTEDIQNLDLQNLKDHTPKSNWERHFSNLIDSDGDTLQTKWKKLYELRCLIAHNNMLTHNQFLEVDSLTNELNIVFKKAIESLKDISIEKEDIDLLFEDWWNDLNYKKDEIIIMYKSKPKKYLYHPPKYKKNLFFINKNINSYFNENDDIEIDNIKIKNIEIDNIENDDIEIDDIEIDNIKIKNIEIDNIENDDIENDNIENDDIENDDIENEKEN